MIFYAVVEKALTLRALLSVQGSGISVILVCLTHQSSELFAGLLLVSGNFPANFLANFCET